MSIITAKGLSKSYGNKLVLNDISFNLPEGHIIGLLGPNGCGKTTLMKILTGLIHDYTGSILVDGKVPGHETKAITSFLPDQSFIHKWMRCVDAVDYFNDFFIDFDRKKAEDMIARFGLDPKQKARTLSKGQQEKLLLSLTMSRAAKLYILDEPMGGVDPATRAAILQFIMQNYAQKSTLLISTHLINDLETAFTHAMFLGGGKVLANAPVEALTQGGQKRIEDVFKEVFHNVW